MKTKSLLSKFTFFLPKIMKYLPFSFQKYAVKSTPCVTRPQAQKQPSTGVLRKTCSENMQKIYRRTPMPKCNFNKVAKQLY